MPIQCYLANFESLQYRWMLFLDLLSEFENDDSGIAVKCYSATGMSLLVSISVCNFYVIIIVQSARANHGLAR